jgi:hypothetical protein
MAGSFHRKSPSLDPIGLVGLWREERVQADPRGPGGPPYNFLFSVQTRWLFFMKMAVAR